jgi:hypothetical protein
MEYFVAFLNSGTAEYICCNRDRNSDRNFAADRYTKPDRYNHSNDYSSSDRNSNRNGNCNGYVDSDGNAAQWFHHNHYERFD